MALPATASLPQNGSIVARWKLDEASGNRADSVGSNTLTDNNTVTAGTGQFSTNAADFELANTEYLSIADNAALSITGKLTCSTWIKLESDTANMCLLGKWDTGGAGRSYLFFYDGGNTRFDFQNSNNGNDNGSIARVTWDAATATWYHVAVVYDTDGSAKFYVNGAQQGSTVTGLNTSIFDGTAAVNVGAWGGGNNPYDGLMEDMIVWGGVALSGAEITSLYNAYFPAPFVPKIIIC